MPATGLPPPADDDTVTAPVGSDQPNDADLGRSAAPAALGPRNEGGSPEPPQPPTGPPEHRHGSLPLMMIVGAVLLAVLIGVGGCFGITQLTSSDSEKPAGTAPTTGSPSPTTNETFAPQPTERSPSLSPTQPTSPTAPSPSAKDSPGDTVEAYFAAINAGDYNRAWDLGGKNLTRGSYSSFVQSFEGTAYDSVTVLSIVGDEVEIELDATQTDGTHRYFAGTYTVRRGVIVAANIERQ